MNHDATTLNDFLSKLSKNKNFKGNIEFTNNDQGKESIWNAKDYIVYELSHTINILIFCEYIKTIYHYILLIDNCFKKPYLIYNSIMVSL